MTIYQVRTQFTGTQGGPFLNTLYFNSAGGTAGQAVTAVGTFWTAVDVEVANNLSWTTESEVQHLNEATGALVDVTATTPQTGSGGDISNQAAFATQGLIRLLTADVVGGRRVKGRIFVPGITVSSIAEGLLDTANITAWNSAGNALVADATSTLVVWHRPVAGGGGSMHTVGGVDTQTQLAVLRSRRD